MQLGNVNLPVNQAECLSNMFISQYFTVFLCHILSSKIDQSNMAAWRARTVFNTIPGTNCNNKVVKEKVWICHFGKLLVTYPRKCKFDNTKQPTCCSDMRVIWGRRHRRWYKRPHATEPRGRGSRNMDEHSDDAILSDRHFHPSGRRRKMLWDSQT